MRGTFAILKNWHCLISGADAGFTLPNLRSGKYTVAAWHESYGKQAQEVPISRSDAKTVNFVFKAKAC